MKVLVDTNVVLDVLLARKEFAEAATEIFAMLERSEMSGYLCATTLTTIDYLLSQALPKKQSHQALQRLMELFEIAPVNRSVIEEALASRVDDFEDAVLEKAGELAGVDAIITRNTRDFRRSSIKAVDPLEFLASLPGS